MKIMDKTTRRLIREARPIAGYLALGGILDILSVFCTVAAPAILGRLVQALYDAHFAGETAGLHLRLLPGLLILAGVYALGSLFGWLNMVLMNNVVSRHYSCGIRVQLSDKFRFLPVGFVDQTPVGDVLSRMTGDVSEVGGYVHQVFDVMVKGVFQVLMIMAAMFLENWMLALLVVVFAPASVWLSAKLAAISEKHYDAMFACSGELTDLVEEAFSNYPTTKAYNLEEYTAQKHGAINEKLRQATKKAGFLGNAVWPIMKFVNALAYILISLVGGWLIVARGLSVGAVVTLVLYSRQFATPLEQIAMGISDMKHIKAAAQRVFGLLDMEPEEDPDATLRQPVQGGVELDDISFSYRPEEPLLENVSLTVRPGQKVAIVGPTGGGKTTIVNLLMRFYDVQRGRILLDGQDIAAVSRDAVRSAFGMVLQDTWLFRGTIGENVAYGKPDATREQIEQACRKAHCHHFIQTMPQGYDTLIDEDTVSLSGGQKQLLTIARALLAERPLLILDEATSNVDTRTELLIQEAMDTLMRGKTCFVIAHRLSTIVDADLILVLDHGKIVEQGTHRELLEKKGFYHALYNSQYAV